MGDLDKMNENMARIEHLIWLPGAFAAGDDVLPDCFCEEFVDYLPEKSDALLYKQLPELLKLTKRTKNPEPWMVAETLSRRGGFLIQAMTPVAEYRGDGCSYSWGYAHFEWLYCDAPALIADVVCEWAAAKQAQFKAKSAKREANADAQ